MQRYFLSDAVRREDGRIWIEGDDFHHMAHVMRMRAGDLVRLVADGRTWTARLEAFESGAAKLELLWELFGDPEPCVDLTWLQGLPKGDKADTVIRHAAEIGAARVCFFAGERSVGALPDGRRADRLVRWRKVAKETAELAQRSRVPDVAYAVSLQEGLAWAGFPDGVQAGGAMRPAAGAAPFLLVPYEAQDGSLPGIRGVLRDAPRPARAAFAIGPEGGFSPAETARLAAAGGRLCTLGPRILRTESAGFAVAAILLYEWGEMRAGMSAAHHDGEVSER